MGGLQYNQVGGSGGLMTSFSGTFTTADMQTGIQGPTFPGIVLQLFFNITANATFAANFPSLFFYFDAALGNYQDLQLPVNTIPFNFNYIPFTPINEFYYEQPFNSSFLVVQDGGPGLSGVNLNYTALCWIPS
jgi:hypothetical protein